jgi:hypothetical protein
MPLAHGPPHQFRDDGAFVLIAEGLVEFRLHFIRYTEIDGCHCRPQLLKSSTTKLYAGRRRRQWPFRDDLSNFQEVMPIPAPLADSRRLGVGHPITAF